MLDVKSNLINLINDGVSHGVSEENINFVIRFVQSLEDTDSEKDIVIKWGEFYRTSWLESDNYNITIAWAILAVKECLSRTIDRELLGI